MSTKAVVAGYVRTPFHFANKGQLARVRPDDLTAHVINALLEKAPVNKDDLEDVIIGCAFPEGEQGFNVARIISLIVGLPKTVAGTTVNRFCGSSMQAIHMAVGAIEAGAGKAFICGGVESMTRVPMGGFNPSPNPALAARKDAVDAYISMGDTAENLAKKFNISRKEQEEYALHSHQKAAKAWAEGKYADTVISVKTPDGIVVDKDGCVRGDSSLEALATLKPAFQAEGSVTAGTSSPLTDGASATLICDEAYAKANGLPILARIRAIAVAGCDPEIMGYGPVPATHKALARAGISIKDIDVFEFNEAFAVQAMTVARELQVPDDKLNVLGGAVALGHPMGASGARITGQAAYLLKQAGKQFGMSTMCIGGGQGITTILEAV